MKSRILNVGCGEDRYGTHFIDLYPKRDDVVKCDFDKEKFPYPANYFDEVFAENVFEHLKNPLNFLTESHRVLKKGGKIVILTDNAGFWGIFGVTHHGGYEKIKQKQRINEDRHYSLFTSNHLDNWLQATGFKKIKVEYFTNYKQIKKGHIIPFKILAKLNKRFSPHLKAVGEKA